CEADALRQQAAIESQDRLRPFREPHDQPQFPGRRFGNFRNLHNLELEAADAFDQIVPNGDGVVVPISVAWSNEKEGMTRPILRDLGGMNTRASLACRGGAPYRAPPRCLQIATTPPLQ